MHLTFALFIFEPCDATPSTFAARPEEEFKKRKRKDSKDSEEVKEKAEESDSRKRSRVEDASNGNDQPEKEQPHPKTSRISLKHLQEMALTVFLRENWERGQFEMVEATLKRDPTLGLGITVAGYVHKKEEIGGVFVKAIVPRSAAAHCGLIKIHDLIMEVNGTSLEHLSHADSVRIMVKCGETVKLKLIRFAPNSPQAQCLNMLHEQETDTQVIDVQSSNPDLITEWKRKLNEDVDIISAVIRPDKKANGDGLGIAFEGTVDVVNGQQLCPHHYIESIRDRGPAAKTGLLQAGDELLQVNHSPLYGESHITVQQALSRAVHSAAPVTLIVARRAQRIHMFQPNPEQSLPLSFPLLASGHESIVKAKSELNISMMHTSRPTKKLMRSRSLQPLTGLAVWHCVPLVVHLEKGAKGLGFSIVDYQDPRHDGETVIVIQSLVPGGVAQADGRIVPGDRLLFVNDHDLSNSSLQRAVSTLKAAPMGWVRLGIAKPVPIEQCRTSSHSPIISRSERLLARGSSPRSRRKQPSTVTSSQETVWIGADQYRKLHPQSYYPSHSASYSSSERSLSSMCSWSPSSSRSPSPSSPSSLRGSWTYDVVYLPSHLERTVKVSKGALSLGLSLDADKDKGVNGCTVKNICHRKAAGLDGRIQVGDYIVKLNAENLRNVTNSQARSILKRANLLGIETSITYITAADAKVWKERFHREASTEGAVTNRLSPKVFPKFYRSPYFERKGSKMVPVEPVTAATTSAPTGTFTTDDTDISEAIDEDSRRIDISHTDTSGVEHLEGKMDVQVSESERDDYLSNLSSAELHRFIDLANIDEFIQEIIEAALQDAALELSVSTQIPEWSSGNSGNKPETETETDQVEDEPPIFSEYQQALSTARDVDKSSSEERQSIEREDERRLSITVIEREAKEAEPVSASEASKAETQSEKKEEPPAVVSTTTQSQSLDSSGEKEKRVVNEKDREGKQSTTMSTMSTSSGGTDRHADSAKINRSKYWGEPRTVVLHREPNKSFGISIVGGRVEVSQKGGLPGTGSTVAGIFIKSVLPNSAAGKSGQMSMGDRVISVNGVDLRDATHEFAVETIKNAQNPVKFVLQSLQSSNQHNQLISSASNSTMGSVKTENLERRDEPPPMVTVIKEEEPSKDSDKVASPPAVVKEEPALPEPVFVVQKVEVESEVIERTDTIRERKITLKSAEIPPPDGAVTSAPIQEIAAPERKQSENNNRVPKQPSLDKAPQPVEVETPTPERKESKTSRGSDKERRQDSVRSDKSDKEKKKKDSVKKKTSEDKQESRTTLIVSDVSSSEAHEEEPCHEVDMDELEKLGIEKDSAAALPREVGDDDEGKFKYTQKKLLRKYGHMPGEVFLTFCEKAPEAGLGISLAGNKDRRQLNVFVVAVKIACPLAVRIGDEILEINGRVLRGISHVAASTKIKQCCDEGQPIHMVVMRREGAMQDCAVKPDHPSTSSASVESERVIFNS
ncbi:hypothetical protein WR25_14180 [Diploscapter pachys]|uniref:PDZ domain-containing protein n=1 Tax=Diploscapter pachys TaxID=2018661 RepID=A0A2A2KUZ0_9BILA|nr:hypothetical protein WR25_14180 [Diploscapter pachys]